MDYVNTSAAVGKSSRSVLRSCRSVQKTGSAAHSLVLKGEHSARLRRLSVILKKLPNERTFDEVAFLNESNRRLVHQAECRVKRSALLEKRSLEQEDASDVFTAKCNQLVDIISKAKHLVVYTGAGISTAARIPDYRGPNGIWTQLYKTGGTISKPVDIALAEPTYTHLSLAALCNANVVEHIVSQNCDGLHIRSNTPQSRLSEIHGNMFIEVCVTCKTQYFRDFDVTEKTSLRKHKTGRKCSKQGCGGDLIDTIVHFGEKGKLEWPLNWDVAAKAAGECDVILCLGSSLKVLRKYPCLWQNKKKVKLCIVNLQWTPKDSQASLKINGKCDDVMRYMVQKLGYEHSVGEYKKSGDPLEAMHTALSAEEKQTCNRVGLFSDPRLKLEQDGGDSLSDDSNKCPLPGWFGKGLRMKRK